MILTKIDADRYDSDSLVFKDTCGNRYFFAYETQSMIDASGSEQYFVFARDSSIGLGNYISCIANRITDISNNNQESQLTRIGDNFFPRLWRDDRFTVSVWLYLDTGVDQNIPDGNRYTLYSLSTEKIGFKNIGFDVVLLASTSISGLTRYRAQIEERDFLGNIIIIHSDRSLQPRQWTLLTVSRQRLGSSFIGYRMYQDKNLTGECQLTNFDLSNGAIATDNSNKIIVGTAEIIRTSVRVPQTALDLIQRTGTILIGSDRNLLESSKFQGYIRSFWIDDEIIGTSQIGENVDSRGVVIPFVRYGASVERWSKITSTTITSENRLLVDSVRNGTVFVTDGLILKDTWTEVFVDYRPDILDRSQALVQFCQEWIKNGNLSGYNIIITRGDFALCQGFIVRYEFNSLVDIQLVSQSVGRVSNYNSDFFYL